MDTFLAALEEKERHLISKINITVNMFLDGKGPIMGYADADMVLRDIQADLKKLKKWMYANDPGD